MRWWSCRWLRQHFRRLAPVARNYNAIDVALRNHQRSMTIAVGGKWRPHTQYAVWLHCLRNIRPEFFARGCLYEDFISGLSGERYTDAYEPGRGHGCVQRARPTRAKGPSAGALLSVTTKLTKTAGTCSCPLASAINWLLGVVGLGQRLALNSTSSRPGPHRRCAGGAPRTSRRVRASCTA